MSRFQNQLDYDEDDAANSASGRKQPTLLNQGKKSQTRQRPKSNRTAVNDATRRGIHQRRAKRMSW